MKNLCMRVVGAAGTDAVAIGIAWIVIDGAGVLFERIGLMS